MSDYNIPLWGSRGYAGKRGGGLVLRIVSVAVDGRYLSRNVLRAAPGMLLLVFVFAGLLLMHGVQASPSPADFSGVPLMSSSGSSMSPAAACRCAAGHSCDCGGHQHGHPAGQMCLALLVLGILLLVAALLVRRRFGRTCLRRSNQRERAHPGRSPPVLSIFQLSVLRL
jgi:hypothetical protein